jgi:hypothetical protein
MSDPNPAAIPDSGAAPASETRTDPEFFARINEVLAVANQIARNRGTMDAFIVLANSVARYGAHHYKTRVQKDSAEERRHYAEYVGSTVAQLVTAYMPEMAGELPPAADEKSP